MKASRKEFMTKLLVFLGAKRPFSTHGGTINVTLNMYIDINGLAYMKDG